MKCPKCKSRNIEILDIYDTEKIGNTYTEKGNSSCEDCGCEFDFKRKYKLTLENYETYNIID